MDLTSETPTEAPASFLGGTDSTDAPAATDGAPAPVQGGGDSEAPWYADLPEDLRTDKILRLGSVVELAKSYNESQKLISSKGYAPPGEDATPEQLEQFYSQIGRPEKPDDYQFRAPEGLELSEAEQDILEQAKIVAHGANLRPDQYQRMAESYLALDRALEQEGALQAEERQRMWSSELRREWGAQFAENAARVSIAAQKLPGLASALRDSGLDGHPGAMADLAKIAGLLMEDRSVGGNPASLAARLEALEANPALGDPGHPDHHKIVEERASLIIQMG